MELIHRLLSRKYAGFFFFILFWGQTLRVREANKVIKSNQKFRSLTPELTAEAVNALINSCSAVNEGRSETLQRPLLCEKRGKSLLRRCDLVVFQISQKWARFKG